MLPPLQIGIIGALPYRLYKPCICRDASTKLICKGRPYKYMVCRDGMVGAAGQAASTNHRQPPLQMFIVVVGVRRMA